MPMHYGYGQPPMMGYAGFGLLSFAFHVLVIVLIVWFIIALLRRRGPHGHRMWEMWESRSALQILNERFARGEINKEEYEDRKKVLMSK